MAEQPLTNSQAFDPACCSALYGHPLARLLLGESLHPGGLALTRRLAERLHLHPQMAVLDVACGFGASARLLAAVFKCHVTGLDPDPAAIASARAESARYRLHTQPTFIEGRAESIPAADSSFDAVLCECATSLFAERAAALREIRRVLKPGGRLLLTDVTFRPERLPQALDLPLAAALCIPLGYGPERFAEALQGAGFLVTASTDCSESIARLLDKIAGFLGAAQEGPARAAAGALAAAVAPLRSAQELVTQGELGYWAFLAEKVTAT